MEFIKSLFRLKLNLIWILFITLGIVFQSSAVNARAPKCSSGRRTPLICNTVKIKGNCDHVGGDKQAECYEGACKTKYQLKGLNGSICEYNTSSSPSNPTCKAGRKCGTI